MNRPDLVKVLCDESALAVDRSTDAFGAELSQASRLGGPAMPQTQRGKECFMGMLITFGLKEKLESAMESGDSHPRIMLKTKVTKGQKDKDGNVFSC